MHKRVCRLALAVGASLMASSPAFTVPATFHLMQIEQAIGGVGGNLNLQAIQLRMRAPGQTEVAFSRIRAWDASGANPVLIVDMATDVTVGGIGSRVLISSSQFASTFGPPPDFTMTTLIPASYLPAGKLTFEDDAGNIQWGLAWGGAAYTGTNNGVEPLNDPDLNFNPPFALPLPSTSNQSLLFPGAASASSTNNAADYVITAGNAVFTNNAGQSAQVPVELMDFSVR
jgi:hypothetical protein